MPKGVEDTDKKKQEDACKQFQGFVQRFARECGTERIIDGAGRAGARRIIECALLNNNANNAWQDCIKQPSQDKGGVANGK